jgi:type I restriction enzyme M protein
MARSKRNNDTAANLGFEEKLWQAADAMRGHMDPGEYKHVALGLIFLKYISDAFEEARREIAEEDGADVEDRDEYLARDVFFVPPSSRWGFISNNATQPNIPTLIDKAMQAIEKENPDRLKGVLPKNYVGVNTQVLGEVVTLIDNIPLGDRASRATDVLGRVYEYFLGRFAAAEGKGGGEFYTPSSVVKLLVEMLEPYKGRVYDPCCGSGGMFVQSEKFIEEHGGRRYDISVYGQESNPTTWRLAKMNLAIRGIDANLGGKNADSFHEDLHRDVRADFVLANPPFNDSNWGGDRRREDPRWVYGTPPPSNANYAWVQQFIHHLAPNGVAGFVLANGSMSSNQSGEGKIRRQIIEADLVDCMVALPGQLFYTTQIPVCLWFIAKNKANGQFRDRSGETLFIDARKMGTLVDRTHRELTDDDLRQIADTYHAWRGEPQAGEYEDVAGYCVSATKAKIEKHGFVLTPGRYVGAADVEDDDEPFDERMAKLTSRLLDGLAESDRLRADIERVLSTYASGGQG